MEKFYIFIINPKAGNGRGEKVWEKVKRNLQEQNIPYRSFFTQRPGHGKDIAQQMAHIHHEHLKGIVTVGGDGTMHEVINGLSHHPAIPVSFIPAGSGNDFARGFKIPRATAQALLHIVSKKSRIRRFDIGEYRLRKRKHKPSFFTSSLGIGFDGEVARRTNESKYKGILNKIGLGSLSYIITVVKLAMTYQPFQLKMKVDGKELEFSDVWLIATTNIKYYGGGMKISPDAIPNDGLLNVCIVHNLSRRKLLILFGTVFLGLHTKLKEVTLLVGKEIEVDTNKPVTMHADGELIGSTPVNIKIHSKRLLVK